MDAADLSGRWYGSFRYPDGAVTAFTAELVDAGGLLSGRIVEPDEFVAAQPPIDAVVDGRREGRAVRFTKFYDDPAGHYDTVLYIGPVAGDGREVTGRWTVSGNWSGDFIMIREAPAPNAIADAEAEVA